MVVEVTQNLTQVTISSVGVQGPKGDVGDSGLTQDVGGLASTASLNQFTSSYLTDSASFANRLNNATNEQDLSTYLSASVFNNKTGSFATTSSFNSFTSSYLTDSASFANRLNNATNEQDLSTYLSASVFNNKTGSFATTGSNTFNGNQTINGTITLDNNSVIKDNANQSISFGVDAAESGQGTQSTAIGSNAGQTDQGNGATALGALAGNLEQGQSAVAIGALAGSTQQGDWAIAIGTQAGGINQGNYSIALGNLAGGLNQAANSVVINATGTQLDNTTASSLKIAPIRINDDGSKNVLVYNTTTKEVSYSADKFATTGSNTFIGNQTISGSVYLQNGESILSADKFDSPAGDLTLRAGDSVSSDAGDLTVRAGDTVTGIGGNLIISAGDTTTGNAGTLNISSGETITGNGGNFTINAGQTISGDGGDVSINAGQTVTGAGGDVSIKAGDTVTGAGGHIILTTGDSVNGNPGDITLRIVSASVNKDWVFGSGSLIFPDSSSQTTAFHNNGVVSSSQQIQNYDLFAFNSNLYTATGSLQAQLNGVEAYTASLKAAAIVSSSTQISNYYKFAETASANTFYGTQTINGNLQLSSTSPLVYNAGNTNAMLFGFFDGGTIYGPYYQIFGSNYSNTTQRGSAEFVFDSRNGGYSGFNVAEFNGSTWLRKFRVSQYGAEVTGSFTVDGGITGSLMASNNVVSSSTQIVNYNLFALTASANTFYGTQSVTGSVRISGSIDDIKYIDFDTVAPATGIARLGWDGGEGTLTLGLSGGNVDMPIGVLMYETAFNEDSSSISKGEVVRVSGAQGNRVAVKKANNLGDEGSATTLAIAAEIIGVGAEGKVVTKGPLKGINTTAFNEGDMLYLSSTPGGITNIKPQAPFHDVRIGVAQRIHASVGIINVQMQNGYELDEIHDVRITTASLANKQLLAYSGSVWANQTISQLGIAITGSNTFIGIETISGSLLVSGSTLQTGNNTLIGNTVLSGSLEVSGSSNFHNSIFIVTGSSHFTGSHFVNGVSTFSGSIYIASGSSYYRAGNKLFNYGQWCSLETQSGSANTAYPMKLGTKLDGSEGVYVSNNLSNFPTRVYLENTGIYNIQFSAQLHTTTAAQTDFSVWLSKDGTNITNSNTEYTIEIVAGGGYLAATRNFLEPITSGSYVELFWSATTSTGQLLYKATQSTPTRPATPSCIVTITQVA